ncbi:hypothetical protein [Streptococcus pluranimalium]
MNKFFEGKNMDLKTIFEYIIVLALLPGLVRGMFYVGHEVGEAIASIL